MTSSPPPGAAAPIGADLRAGRPALLPSPAATGPTVQGRWSLTETLFKQPPAAGPKLRAQAELMLERYGILTREMAWPKASPAAFRPSTGASQPRGCWHRPGGYFVEGLGGAQFALSGAVEAQGPAGRGERPGSLHGACRHRPGLPLGPTLPWPKLESGPQGCPHRRRLCGGPGGHPLLYIERGGRGILRLDPALEGESLARPSPP